MLVNVMDELQSNLLINVEKWGGLCPLRPPQNDAYDLTQNFAWYYLLNLHWGKITLAQVMEFKQTFPPLKLSWSTFMY